MLSLERIATLFILLFVGVASWGLAEQSQTLDIAGLELDYLWQILCFSIVQAGLSATIACLGGLLVGRAWFLLAPRTLPFQLLLAKLCFVSPVILVVLGTVGSFGNSGFWQNSLPLEWNLYGLPGILLAHSFLNLPLVASLSYQSLCNIPQAYWRQAQLLGFSSWQSFKLIEWPMLKTKLASLFCLVFLLCFGSFTVVLALGGGPASSTLEVAIYQALRYDFDPAFALQCALLQLVICLALGAYLMGREQQDSAQFQQNMQVTKPTLNLRSERTQQAVLAVYWLFIGSIFVGLLAPLVELDWAKLPFEKLASSALWSVKIALLSALCTLLLAGLLLWRNCTAQASQGLEQRFTELVASAMLLAPAIVITTGWYFFLVSRGWLYQYTVPLAALINALMALPFFLRSLKPRLLEIQKQYGKLQTSLALSSSKGLILVVWPLARPALTTALGLSLLLSLGDMGVVAMLGDVEVVPLPLLMYHQLSSYQFAEASFTAACLLVLASLLLGSLHLLLKMLDSVLSKTQRSANLAAS